MKIIERKDLRVGYVVSYSYPSSGQVLHGTIVHLGLGLAARHAVWVRCSDDPDVGKVECILLDYIMGVTTYVSR